MSSRQMLSPNGFPSSPSVRGIACGTRQAYITAETGKRERCRDFRRKAGHLFRAARREKEIVMTRISLRVNGTPQVVDTDPSTPLLYVLRDDLGLNGPKFGCGLSQCGCCTVMLEGNAVRSCSIAV